MRVREIAAAGALSAGIVLIAGSAFANDRLEGGFSGYDEKCAAADEGIETGGWVYLYGSSFEVTGTAATFGGTDGDYVEISYRTPLVDKVSASDKSARVSQKRWSQICVRITSDVEARNINTCFDDDVEKCAVKGSLDVNLSQERGKLSTSADCSGTNLSSAFTSDQIASIAAAFPKGNKCRVRFDPKPSGQRSRISIKMHDSDADLD